MTVIAIERAVLALLQETRAAGHKGLIRTPLMKFVYLLDYFVAKEQGGCTYTEAKWQFLHFGPYAAIVQDVVDALVARGVVLDATGGGTEKDYTIYSIGDAAVETTLAGIGISANVRIKLQDCIRKYAFRLNELLHFVYFHTEPMQDALPEQYLDFSECRRDLYAELKPISLRPIPGSRIAEFKRLLENRRKVKGDQAQITWDGRYDDAYEQAISELDSESDYKQTSGKLHL